MGRHTAIALLSALVGLGCGATFSDPLGRTNSLEAAQEDYTQLVRWGEIERASLYVDPELRDEYLKFGRTLEEIRITDYESGEFDINEDESEASVVVTYRAFSLTTAVDRALREEQAWHREKGNKWLVRSDLPRLLQEHGERP